MFNAPHRINRMVPSPCLGCGERHVGCHGHCDQYRDYRVALNREMNAAWEFCGAHRLVEKYEKAVCRRRK